MTTEFKTLEEMTPAELAFERSQHWSIVKSDTTVWIHRNSVPFMHVPSRLVADAEMILSIYGLKCAEIDGRQPTWNFEQYRRELAEPRWRIRFRNFWHRLTA